MFRKKSCKGKFVIVLLVFSATTYKINVKEIIIRNCGYQTIQPHLNCYGGCVRLAIAVIVTRSSKFFEGQKVDNFARQF